MKKIRLGLFASLALIILAASDCKKKNTPPPPPPPPAGQNGIASQYPGDAGIQNNTDVIFTEMFEESNVAAAIANWTDNEGGSQMAFAADKPAGSTGSNSMRFTTVMGTQDAVYLFKRLNPGINDSLFLRYYVKYNTNGTFHHAGSGVGGYNPPSNWPIGTAGLKPTGSDRFKIAVEPLDASTPGTTGRMDYYTYWMNMRGNPVPNTYYGNSFINSPSVSISLSNWNCIEIMVKLNNPVSGSNGEMALWINGTKVSHLKQGSPNGTWTWDTFTPNSSGSPFEGFQWRNTTDLNINYLLIQHFVSQDAVGQQNSIYYDHVVAAKKYIGPIKQ